VVVRDLVNGREGRFTQEADFLHFGQRKFNFMSLIADIPLVGGPGRRRLRRATGEALIALAVTGALVAGLDAGARMLGPVLIVVPALAGIRAVRAWWRGLGEQWFAAEIVLVASGWALFAAAFAGVQYLVFSLIPGAFFVDADYGRTVSPRYHAEWLRDSTRTGGRLTALDSALRLLRAHGPANLAPDTPYALAGGSVVMVREQCEVLLSAERCPWRLTMAPGPGGRAVDLLLEAPPEGQRFIARRDVEREIEQGGRQVSQEIGELGRKLADPGAFVQPRIADFLYDTAIAFSGRDSGVFVPVGALARMFHVLESLASYLLFGIVVSRVAAAAGPRLGRPVERAG
jgi:hypothetical protein